MNKLGSLGVVSWLVPVEHCMLVAPLWQGARGVLSCTSWYQGKSRAECRTISSWGSGRYDVLTQCLTLIHYLLLQTVVNAS